MRDVTLPVEFSGLQGKVEYVRRVSATEYSSSCPQCGGTLHKGGEPPDRFRMWTNANGKNKVMGWCRHCSYIWFPDTTKALSPEEIERWRKEQIAIETERKLAAEQALRLLRSEKLWIEYHKGLNDWAKSVIKSWGIRQDWADYWKLGLVKDYIVRRKDESYHAPAISIPVWQKNFELRNVKLRILNPKDDHDRYRSLYKTGEGLPFVALPKLESPHCLLVEGEKKAMVCAQWSNQEYQVIGVPTKTPSEAALRQLDEFETITVCLDPDAKIKEKNGVSPLRRMVDILGRERVKVLDLPDKIDDLINRGTKLKYAMLCATEVK